MRRSVAWMLLSIASFVLPSHSQPADIPPELRGWEAWVLDGRESVRCPLAHGGRGGDVPGDRICRWPGPIVFDADRSGASFTQTLQVFAPGDLPLPGDATLWPQDVLVDGRATPVVSRQGRPHVRLSTGTHRITGRFDWARMPETVALPGSVSLVALTVDGARIALPERAGDSLRLGAVREQAQVDQLDLRVYRKLTDRIPGILQTRLTFNVAGRPREETLEPVLPVGFVPMQITGPLPARLQPDGRLRVQVRPGTWTLELTARSASALEAIRVPQPGIGPEAWTFEPVERLRSAALEGAASIDPAQANVPDEWRQWPAYGLSPGEEFSVRERSRGLGEEDRNHIQVDRNLWWDFDGSGYTFQDFVSGRMQQDWRLEMAAPYHLQGAREGDESLLVTGGADGRAGVELRTPALALEATGRLEPQASAVPVSGWDTRLASLVVTLRLPPGHRLVAAPGVDSSPSAWLDRWRLLDIFAVLLVTAVAFRVAGVPAALLALAAFALMHHELPALTWATLNVLIAFGLARAMPEGRIRKWLVLWRAVSLAFAVVMLVPFALSQARLALFPQLEPAVYLARVESAGMLGAERMDAPAAPPAPMRDVPSDEGAATESVTTDAVRGVPQQEIVVTGAARERVYGKRYSVVDRYAPGTQLQNGPGVPGWNFQVHTLGWGGPVEPSQSMRLVVLTPFWVSLWRIAGIGLLLLTLYAIVRPVYPALGQPRLDRWLKTPPVTAAAMAALALLLAPPPAGAQTPSPELLEELKQRLSRPPKCAPDCIGIARAQIELYDDALTIRLEAHAQAHAALALPEAPQRWQPERVLIDGAPADALARDAQGTLLLALPEGVHVVTMRGPVPDTEALRLVFRERPAHIQVSAPGWQVAGIDDGRLLADSLSLVRPARASLRDGSAAGAPAQREEFPPFVRVTRTMHLGLDWTVTTRVERLAPEQGAFTLRLPLLPGESVLTAGLPVADGQIELAMPAGVAHAGWTSALGRTESIELAAPVAAPYVEVWRFEVGPIWHLDFAGTPEVIAPDPHGPTWVHHFEPRPSESLRVTVTQPAALEGPTFAFENVRHTITPGRRSTDVLLEIDYRSTQGGRHVIGLPEGARLKQVSADGAPLLIRAQDGALELPLQPGSHQLRLDWQTDTGVSLATRPGAVKLGAPASNVATTIVMPVNRWLLAAAGDGVGPAILYWAELAVFVVVAVVLGRLARTPLATHEWLLVGLGLSTFSWGVLLLFAVWVFAFDWRGRWAANADPRLFNAVQVGLTLLTIVALGSLVAAIPNGLLGAPDMHVTGGGSHAGQLEWFVDRVERDLPRPVAVSVSIWFYKAAMLAWALWLSFALVRWVRRAWEAFGAQGHWRRRGGSAQVPQIG